MNSTLFDSSRDVLALRVKNGDVRKIRISTGDLRTLNFRECLQKYSKLWNLTAGVR